MGGPRITWGRVPAREAVASTVAEPVCSCPRTLSPLAQFRFLWHQHIRNTVFPKKLPTWARDQLWPDVRDIELGFQKGCGQLLCSWRTTGYTMLIMSWTDQWTTAAYSRDYCFPFLLQSASDRKSLSGIIVSLFTDLAFWCHELLDIFSVLVYYISNTLMH